VATAHVGEHVDYAVNLPPRDGGGHPMWLPIDAGFPLEDYEVLLVASEHGDAECIENASHRVEFSIRNRASVL
jgi:DNA recombination protein RmuC